MKQMHQNLKMVSVIPHLRQIEEHVSPALTKIVFPLRGTEVRKFMTQRGNCQNK